MYQYLISVGDLDYHKDLMVCGSPEVARAYVWDWVQSQIQRYGSCDLRYIEIKRLEVGRMPEQFELWRLDTW